MLKHNLLCIVLLIIAIICCMYHSEIADYLGAFIDNLMNSARK
jgi:hypothetical protein